MCIWGICAHWLSCCLAVFHSYTTCYIYISIVMTLTRWKIQMQWYYTYTFTYFLSSPKILTKWRHLYSLDISTTITLIMHLLRHCYSDLVTIIIMCMHMYAWVYFLYETLHRWLVNSYFLKSYKRIPFTKYYKPTTRNLYKNNSWEPWEPEELCKLLKVCS